MPTRTRHYITLFKAEIKSFSSPSGSQWCHRCCCCLKDSVINTASTSSLATNQDNKQPEESQFHQETLITGRPRHPVVLISRQVLLLADLVERTLFLNRLEPRWQGGTYQRGNRLWHALHRMLIRSLLDYLCFHHCTSPPSLPPPSVGLLFLSQCRVSRVNQVFPPLPGDSNRRKQCLFQFWSYNGSLL